MNVLMNVIQNGWPECRCECLSHALELCNHKDELSEILIPRDLRRQMMESVHIGHMGVGKCYKRARDIIFLAHDV